MTSCPVSDLHAAAIHGSWVAGSVRPDSDIDLMVVSDGDRRGVRRIARRVGKTIGREVDVTVLSLEEPVDASRAEPVPCAGSSAARGSTSSGDLGRLAPAT